MKETDKNSKENVSAAKGFSWFARGLRDGIPICMGYFAVSFALGITARGIGMNALQAVGAMAVGAAVTSVCFRSLRRFLSGR